MSTNLSGARVVILGVGKSGLAAARLLRSQGAQVTALDKKPEAALADEAAALKALGAELKAGGEIPEGLVESAKLLVLSPGVPPKQPAVERAKEREIEIVGEAELAYRFVEPKRPFVGITGTNGKSTTTALCGQMFEESGLEVFVGGNLGLPLAESVLSGKRWDAHVVELSSFQLETAKELRCSAAAVTNLTPDHLDRYASPKEYADAKRRIFATQTPEDAAVVNADDPATVALAKGGQGRLYGFTLTDKLDLGRHNFAGGAVATEEGFRFLDGRTFKISGRPLRGAHNKQNAMAAALLGALSGVIDRSIQEGLNNFKGLPHRLESVRVMDNVEWINDSKATNVESAIVALRALEGPVWLIAGGQGKGAPYAPLVEACRGKVKGVLTIGQDAAAIGEAFRGVADVVPCETLDRAVEAAYGRVKKWDVVLLSPACASYDQFKNYVERGDTFRRLVKEL